MIVFETKEVRRIVGRFERGESLLAGLRRLARDHAIVSGWFRGLGAFEWVELCEYDQVTQEYKPARRINSACEALSIEGNISFKDGQPFAHVHATVSRETDRGLEVLGGHIETARVFACEFVVEAYDDIALSRELDPATGLSLWRGDSVAMTAAVDPRPSPPARRVPEPEPAPEPVFEQEPESAPAAPAPGGISWAAAAAASEAARVAPVVQVVKARGAKSGKSKALAFVPDPIPERQKAVDDFDDEPTLEPGDWVSHKQFGLCHVDKVTEDGAIVIKLESSRRKTIKLDYMIVGEPRHDDGRTIYPLTPRKKR